MSLDPAALLTWPVALYLGLVVSSQMGLAAWRRNREREIAARRKAAGLDSKILVDHAVRLETIRKRAGVDASWLIFFVVLPPFLLALLADNPDQRTALGVVFLGILIWALVSATDVARAFLGGIAFRALIGLKAPFQVGDRVTLGAHAGKVLEIGPFFVTLQTVDDDLVSIPTASLWSTPLVSANAGDRASLSVMSFHLSPFVSVGDRQAAEDAIWEAIQRSIYWDFDKPMQIYVDQRRDEIVLTAKAYVASTYNEALFKSDVTRAFLDFAHARSIPLAWSGWRGAPLQIGPGETPP